MSSDPPVSEVDASPEVDERLRTLPKVELHQHVDGSIPAEVTWDLMRHYRLHPAESLPEMRRFLEIQAGEEGTLLAYLDKMHYPLWVTQFYENISKVVEAIGLAAAAGPAATERPWPSEPVETTSIASTTSLPRWPAAWSNGPR